MTLVIAGTSVIFLVIMMGAALAIYARCYRPVPPNQALVITTPRGPIVALSGGALVFPVVDRAETIDLSFHSLFIESFAPSAPLGRRIRPLCASSLALAAEMPSRPRCGICVGISSKRSSPTTRSRSWASTYPATSPMA